MLCRLAVCALFLVAGTVRADEADTSAVEAADHCPCGAGHCTKCSHEEEASCPECEKSLTALDKPCKCAKDDGDCAAGDHTCTGCSHDCVAGEKSCGTCDKACVAGETAITFDAGVLQASSLTFNVASLSPEGTANAGAQTVIFSSPISGQELLQQKLAQRDQLQHEIDELCQSTQTCQQVLVHVKVMEVSLTKARRLGIKLPSTGFSTTGLHQVSHAYTPACECAGGACCAEKCSTETCSTEQGAAHKCESAQCSTEKCSTEKCSTESCSKSKCSHETCAAGKCAGGKCSAEHVATQKCSTETCDGEKCCRHECSGETCADGECSAPCATCQACSYEGEGHDLATLLETLEDQNVAKVLAAPTVATVSGRPASLHVGGEIAVPASSGSGYQFIDFGTKLDVLPISLGDNKVRLEVRPRISEICDERSLEVEGGRIPALRVCQYDTACELEFGQTAVLTGLVQERIESTQTEEGVRETVNEVLLMVVVTPEAVDSTAFRSTLTK